MRRQVFFFMALLTALIFVAGGSLKGRLSAMTARQPENVTVSEETENRGIDNLVLDICMPVVSGFKDAAFEHQLNISIFIQVQNARADAIEKSKENQDYVFVLRVDYDVKCTKGILSMRVTDDLDNGGTGFPHTVYYNVDISNNKLLTLDDLFVTHAYRSVLNHIIGKEINNDAHFFTEEFTGISKQSSFYIAGGRLYIAFAKYEIASGMTGEPVFAISTSAIRNFLKPEYASLFW